MSDAAVGSVSHILKTAFKDVYESNEKTDEAKKARAVKELVMAEKMRKREEARRIAEEEAARRAEEEEAAAAATTAGKKPGKGADKNAHVEEPVETEVPEPEPEEPDEFDDPNHISNYHTPFEKVNLNEVNRGLHSTKVTAIESNLVKSVEEAKELSAYLVKQRIAAWEQEEQEQDDLKKQGILVGQHIPSLPSKLALDENLMTHKYGSYSSNLVIAHTLVQQNLENSMRRTGILPISDAAEKKKLTRTSNNADEKPSKVLPPKIQDTAERRMANENILKSINRKLNYLRNPHNNPNAVGKTLIKAADKDSTAQMTVDIMSSAGRKKAATNTIPLFVADPPEVTFNSYDAGSSYSVLIKFRNVSTISRSLRVIPPSSANYSISPLKYPSSSKAGMVAPGMSVSSIVTFTPDSIGNYEDSLQCATEGGKFIIPIVSMREAPKLSIPSVLNVGGCLVGDATRVVITCHNTGGSGRFRLLRPADYPNVPTDINWDTMGCMRMPPFTVYPVQFVLNRNDSVDITIEYVPLTAGGHAQEFVMLCDNCQVRTFEIVGESKLINVVTSEINGVHVDSADHNVKRDLNFSQVYVGNEDTQEVTVSNTTGIPLEFEWIWAPTETKDRDLTKLGQERVMRREAEELRQKEILDRRDAAIAAGEAVTDIVSENVFPMGEDMLSTAGMTVASSASSAVTGPFEISPSRGVLASDGDQTFTVSYSPTGLSRSSAKAVLMLIKVPMVALVIPGQATMLKRLSDIGHGVFVRLLSWLREIGQPTPYNVMFGIGVEPMRLLSLNMLISLIVDHLVTAEPLDGGETDVRNGEIARYHSDILRFLRMAKVISRHGTNNVSHATAVYVDPKTNLVPVDEIQLVDESEAQLVIGFYLWRRAEAEQDLLENGAPNSTGESVGSFSGRGNRSQRDNVSRDSSTVSLTVEQGVVRVPPVMIDRFQKPNTNLGSPLEAAGLGDGISEMSLGGIASSPDHITVPPITIEDEVYDRDTVLQELYFLQQDPMSHQIWLDYKHSLMLFGNNISSFFNELVKHEAVEYIQESGHTHVACISQKVSGEAQAQRIVVEPPKCIMPGWFAINQSYSGSVTIKNTAPVMTQVEVCSDNIDIFLLAGAPHEALVSHDEQSKNNKQHNLTGEAMCKVAPTAFSISFADDKIIVMPEATVEVNFTLTAHMTGQFELCVPLRTQNSCILMDQILIKVGVMEPTVRFTAPEVDVGLVGVGVEERRSITFTNDTDIPTRYFFKVNQDIDKETLALSLVAAKRSESVRDGNGRSVAPSVAGSRKNSARGKPLMSARGKPLASARSNRTLGSARSSKYLNGDDDDATSTDSYAIENPLALLAVEPPAGILAPRETKTVAVSCAAGRMPQRVRATLECMLYDSKGTSVLSSQYLSLRGEVQAPKATLYPMAFDLGKLYVGNPVPMKVTLENLSNLPTKYRFERPGGDATNYKLTIDSPTGTLPPKSKVLVSMEFEPYTTGLCDDVMAVKVFGIQQPLGFSIRAFVKGIQLGFAPLATGASPPAPLGKPTDVRYPLPGNPPEPPQIAPMDFGNDVPLYERRVLRLAIRNFSAIAVSYKFRVKKFQVGPNVRGMRDGDDDGSLCSTIVTADGAAGAPPASGGVGAGKPPSPTIPRSANVATTKTSGGRIAGTVGGTRLGASVEEEENKVLLVPHEDGVDRFHSVAGKKHMGFRLQRDDDKNYMTLGLGAAYFVESGEVGVLPAWGVQIITVRTFNDMPGIYADDLICEVSKYQAPGTVNVTTLTTPSVYTIPLRMSIQGCPLFIEKDVVGMSVIRSGHPNANTALGKPLLQLGHECVDSEPLVREFYVRNNGSKAGAVKWKVRSLNNNVRGPIKIELKSAQIGTRIDGSARWGMKMSYQFWDDLVKDSSFKVHPMHATIPPFGRQTFTVTLYRTHSHGTENGLLTASVKYDGGDKPSTSSVASGPPAAASSTSNLSIKDGSVNNSSSHGKLLREGSNLTEETRESGTAGGGSRATGARSNEGNNFELTLYLQGDLMLPAIRIDKQIYHSNANENPTIISPVNTGQSGIKLSTAAPILFNRGAVTRDNSVCVKQLTLSNPLQASLIFTTAVEGPFVLKPTSGSDDGELQINKSITTTYSNPGELDMTISNTTRFISSAASVGKIYNLLPQAAAKFAVAFVPKRALREQLLHAATSSTSGQLSEELTTHTGKLILSFSKGQCLHIPLTAKITTPFIFVSVPRVYFGVCAVTKKCEGTILLCNPTNVNATWSVEHVPETTASKGTTGSIKPSSIRVKGFEPKGPPQIDDPSVFSITPDKGHVQGPTVSVTAAMAAPPTDVNRNTDASNLVVEQRLVKSSWQTNTISVLDTLKQRHGSHAATDANEDSPDFSSTVVKFKDAAANLCYPLPITIKFTPSKNMKYSSRYRFTCEYGNSFEVVVQGEGTYEEHEHNPLTPVPRE